MPPWQCLRRWSCQSPACGCAPPVVLPAEPLPACRQAARNSTSRQFISSGWMAAHSSASSSGAPLSRKPGWRFSPSQSAACRCSTLRCLSYHSRLSARTGSTRRSCTNSNQTAPRCSLRVSGAPRRADRSRYCLSPGLSPPPAAPGRGRPRAKIRRVSNHSRAGARWHRLRHRLPLSASHNSSPAPRPRYLRLPPVPRR